MFKGITGNIFVKKEKQEQYEKNIKNILDLAKKIEESSKIDISELVETILSGSVILDSSDIHTEPEEKNVKIRIRIDGILHNISVLDYQTYRRFLSRIKLLSGIKLNITNKPQDGRFSLIIENKKEIDIRVSTLPSEYGETVVMRLLDPEKLIEIEKLGLRKDLFETLNKMIKLPNGMIVVTGPTGSGKTTTLYAILKKIRNPEIKIITIEDPIEYHLEGISQTQVNPKKGYDFANGLRAIVRQDPDVILVGEIRDEETAEIALQASLTGHLVLTTLHTNDAAGTIARFQALGQKPVNIAPALRLAIAQRLIRKVCSDCVKYENPTEEEINILKEEFEKILSKKLEIPQNFKIARPKGCKKCNFTGYKGRIGVYEFFVVDEEMERFIITNPSISDLRKKAIEKGMVLMKQDGFLKVIDGITTIEEVIKNTGE
ncbi:MAG: GspE/PulE family protein [Minisyncoccia bacterium]